MFSNKITQSDPFLDMPASAQNLYFHLNMDADDEGFVNRTKSIMRMIGAREDDLKLLIAKHFIIPFEVETQDGMINVVVVIKHWFIHNKIRSDRMKYTNYTQQKNMLAQTENGAYTLLNSAFAQDSNQMPTKCPPRLEEIRLDEVSIEEIVQSDVHNYSLEQEFVQFWNKYPVKVNKKRANAEFKYLNPDALTLVQILEDIDKRSQTSQWADKAYIPHPSTYLKEKRWNDDYIDSKHPNIRTKMTQPIYSEECEPTSTEALAEWESRMKELYD